jgi:Ca2+-binding RTX toxin-like protein
MRHPSRTMADAGQSLTKRGRGCHLLATMPALAHRIGAAPRARGRSTRKIGRHFPCVRRELLHAAAMTSAAGAQLAPMSSLHDKNTTGEGSDMATTGNDVLIGTPGPDLLDGLTGDDTMIGGFGDDTFVVDSFDDVVVEGENEGHDTIVSSVTYALPENVEILRLTGSADVAGYGNELGNEIYGNGGANSLFGFESGDLLDGGDGNDSLDSDGGDDMVYGGAGDDYIDSGDGQDIIDGGPAMTT